MRSRFLLDTNILIYLQTKRSPGVVRRTNMLLPGEAVMSVVTFGELFYGMSKSLRADETVERLSALCRAIPVLPLPEIAAETYGRTRFELESKGRLIGNNDLWIAAHALASELILVTNNEKEFRRINGLRIENWAAA